MFSPAIPVIALLEGYRPNFDLATRTSQIDRESQEAGVETPEALRLVLTPDSSLVHFAKELL
jgi:hypothetical protein